VFLIGTRVLSGTVSAEQAGELLARLADVLIRSLHGAVADRFCRAARRVPGQEVAIRRWQACGREMTGPPTSI